MKIYLPVLFLALITFFSCNKQDYEFIEIDSVAVSFEEISKAELDSFINELVSNPALLNLRQCCYTGTIKEKIKTYDANVYKALEDENAFSPSTTIFSSSLLTLVQALEDDKNSVEISKIDYDNNIAYMVIDYKGIFEIIGIMINKNNGNLSIYDLINLKQGFSHTDIDVYSLLNSQAVDTHISNNFNELYEVSLDDIIKWGYNNEGHLLIDDHLDEYVILAKVLSHINLLKKEKKIAVLTEFLNSYGELSPVSEYHEFLLAKAKGDLDSNHVNKLKTLIGDSEKLGLYLEKWYNK